jgi:hypothetical protein
MKLYNFNIELQVKTNMDDDCSPYIGLTFYNFNIYYDLGENPDDAKTIGTIRIIKTDFSKGSPYDVLDSASETDCFASLVDKNGVSEKVIDIAFKTHYPFNFNNLYILDRIEFEKEYRGTGLAKEALIKALDILNLDDHAIYLKVFPLQFENLNEKFDEREFKIAQKKLKALFKMGV